MDGNELHSTFPPWLNQQDEPGRPQVHQAQVGKNQGVVAPGDIKDVAAQPWAKRPGHETVSGKDQPEDGSEVRHAETVAGQRTRDRKQGPEGHIEKSGHQAASFRIPAPDHRQARKVYKGR